LSPSLSFLAGLLSRSFSRLSLSSDAGASSRLLSGCGSTFLVRSFSFGSSTLRSCSFCSAKALHLAIISCAKSLSFFSFASLSSAKSLSFFSFASLSFEVSFGALGCGSGAFEEAFGEDAGGGAEDFEEAVARASRASLSSLSSRGFFSSRDFLTSFSLRSSRPFFGDSLAAAPVFSNALN
jgi:hypothetical protein